MNIKEKVNEVKEYVDVKIKYIAATVKPETLVKVTGAALLAAAASNAKMKKAKRKYNKLNNEHEEILDSYLRFSAEALRRDLPKITGEYGYTDFTMKDVLEGDYIVKFVDGDGENINIK